MTRYWLKIAFGALVIFVLGFSAVSAGRHIKNTIHSNKTLTIPLGPFIPFKLDGIKVGTLRSLGIRRGAPKLITGFDLKVRLSDSTALDKLANCHLTVTDPLNIDERTTFTCLPSDTGYVSFGEVQIELRRESGSSVVGQPLLLTPQAIEKIQGHPADSASDQRADSIAKEVRGRVDPQARTYRDSIKAAGYEEQARRMQRRADSIRARSAKPPTP